MTDTALPPGPALPPLLQELAYHRDPLGVLRRARARYGPVFTLRLGSKGPVVFVAAPELVAPLLQSDRAGAARRVILPQASPRSPFGADGDTHRAIRAAMEPSFADTPAPDAIAAIVAEHARRWPRGRAFRLLPRMRTLATDLFVRLVLRVEEPVRRERLVLAIRRLLWTPGNPPVGVPDAGDGLLGAAVDHVFTARAATVARLLDEELAATPRAADDLLARTADACASARETVDALLVVIAAAQEPPSIALTNVLYELAVDPTRQEAFLARPEEREAMVAEALRLRPAASAALRRLTAPLAAGGHTLPAGATVALPSALLHRDPAAFPQPDAFRPARFADGVPPGAPYLPFGGGVRRCIGEPLARAELGAALPAVLGRLRLRAVRPSAERMVVRGTVLVPLRSAVVRVSDRSFPVAARPAGSATPVTAHN